MFAYNLIACIAYAPWVIYIVAHDTVVWSGSAILVIALSALLHFGYSLVLQRGYREADLSVVYPVARGTGPMLSTLGAVFILREAPGAQALCGLALVIALWQALVSFGYAPATLLPSTTSAVAPVVAPNFSSLDQRSSTRRAGFASLIAGNCTREDWVVGGGW